MTDRAGTFLVPHARQALPERRLALHEMMPPEDHYRPRRRGTASRSVLWFTATMSGTVMLLWAFSSMAAVIAFFMVVIMATYWQRQTQQRAVDENQDAIKLLNDGYVEEAAELFEHLSLTEQNTFGHAVFVHNRAVAYMLQGRLNRAFSLFNAVDRSSHFRFGPNRSYEPLLYVEMATCLALMGHIDEARTYRDKASKGLSGGERTRLLIVDAIALLRSGRPQDLLQQAEALGLARGVVRKPTYRALLLLHAFSHRQLARQPEHDDMYRRLMSSLRPMQAGEFDYMSTSWPELADFLAENGIAARRRVART